MSRVVIDHEDLDELTRCLSHVRCVQCGSLYMEPGTREGFDRCIDASHMEAHDALTRAALTVIAQHLPQTRKARTGALHLLRSGPSDPED